ncbi:CPYC type glutaredoxin [Haematococcus lacustris]
MKLAALRIPLVVALVCLGVYTYLRSAPILSVSKASPPPMSPQAAALHFVQSTVASNKVVVWSKSYCPYCRKAKQAMASLLQPDQYLVIEIEERPDMADLQDAFKELTGGSSVPRVFVGGKFLGGGDDTARMAENGELKQLLQAEGVL